MLSFHSLSTDCAEDYSESRGHLKKGIKQVGINHEAMPAYMNPADNYKTSHPSHLGMTSCCTRYRYLSRRYQFHCRFSYESQLKARLQSRRNFDFSARKINRNVQGSDFVANAEATSVDGSQECHILPEPACRELSDGTKVN